MCLMSGSLSAYSGGGGGGFGGGGAGAVDIHTEHEV